MDRYAELAAGFLEGGLGPEDVAELTELLERDRTLRDQFVDLYLQHRALEAELASDTAQSFASSILREIAADRDAFAVSVVRHVRRVSAQAHRRRRGAGGTRSHRLRLQRVVVALATAACLAMAASVTYRAVLEGRTVATVAAVRGPAWAPTERGDQPLAAGAVLRPNATLETGEGAEVRLAYPDGSALRVEGRTRLVFEKGAAKRLTLRRGALGADVRAQPSSRPFSIATAHAEAEVLGTRLFVATGAAQTLLEVESGEVRLTDPVTARSAVVESDHLLVAGEGAPLTPIKKEERMRARAVAMVLAGIAITGPLAAEDGTHAMQITLRPVQERSLKGRPGREGQTERMRSALFDLGQSAYEIIYRAGYDPAKPGQAFPIEGYVGMTRPCSCNWYGGGFLRILLNGEDVGHTGLSSMLLSEHGARGIIDLVWHHRLGDVRLRFLGLPGGDHLLSEIVVDATREPTSLAVALRCYPSFFTSWHKRKGARRIRTPAAFVQENEKTTLAAAEGWWAVYYDEVFDVANGEGEGPCALLLDPEGAERIECAPGGYAVETRITCAPTTRRLRFALWDLKGRTNAQALAYIPTIAATVRQELGSLDFTPRALREFDCAALRAAVRLAEESPAIRTQLGERLEKTSAWLRKAGALQGRGSEAMGIAAQEELLGGLEEFAGFRWEVMLTRLLGEI